MRLRNKRTGEIGELQVTEKHCAVAIGNGTASCGLEIYSSLARLYEEWEDAPEEPKEHYFITEYGGVFSLNEYEGLNNVANIEDYKQIGNYFETEEEAEEAVEKLKAWKRLKDKGFRFDCWEENHHNLGIIEFSFSNVEKSVYDFEQDLNLLFGGEE